MAKTLNILAVSGNASVLRTIEDVMSIDGQTRQPAIHTATLAEASAVAGPHDLVFIDNTEGAHTMTALEPVTRRHTGQVCVLLSGDGSEDVRRQALRAGIDEVLSLEDLQKPVGRRLVEKLMALKDLSDAEELVEQSEERFRGLIEHAHDIILMLDEEATLVYTTPSFYRQLGYETWEALGSQLFDLVHREDLYFFKQGFSRLLVGGAAEGATLEFRIANKSGEWRFIEAIGVNLLKNLTVNAIILNCRDVTEQKRIEAELEKYRRHLEDLVRQRTKEVELANHRADTVLAASPDTLIAIGADGCISFMSQHYATRYPRSASRMNGMHILDAFDLMAAESGIAREDPRHAEMRAWWGRPHGTREFRVSGGRWLRLQAREVGNTGEIVVSTTDITDYKKQQAQLAAQSAELASALAKEKEVVEQQKTFISMVSHEFRTPLTIIDGNAQIIMSRSDALTPEIVEKRGSAIRTAVARLVGLIETLLSAHILDSGKITLDLKPHDLSAIVRAACADQQDISPAHEIRLKMENVPDDMLLDQQLMRHIMSNLLSNAVKYSPDAPLVQVSVIGGSDRVDISVRDQGVGIPEDEQPRIFSKYFRASTSGGIPGSGLGLSLVRQFVELHQGSISLQSAVGSGTVVSVTLPLKRQGRDGRAG